MIVLRSLLLPFYPASLMFVVLFAALLAVTTLVPDEAAVLRIIPAFLLLSWLFNYAYTMLEDAANGLSEPPVLSPEMLGPFEARPLLQLLLCAAVYKVVGLVGGALGAVILVTYLALLPASIGVLGVTQDVIAAINPVALLRTARALGWYYLLIFCLSAGYAYALYVLSGVPVWRFAWYALLGFGVLSIFSFIGSVIFVRRIQLQFEPRSSPERKAEIAEAERIRQRSCVLDEVYGFIRVHGSRRAVDPLGQWLSRLDAQHVTEDVRAILLQAAQWNNDRGLAEVTQFVVGYLIKIARLDLAVETLEATLRRFPSYALDSEEETVTLARRAKAMGNAQLARTIINNFAARAADHHLSDAAKTFLDGLQN